MRSCGSAGSATPSPNYDRRRESTAGGGREHVRTTAMLVAVVLCFVVVELPQGLLAFLVVEVLNLVLARTYSDIGNKVVGLLCWT